MPERFKVDYTMQGAIPVLCFTFFTNTHADVARVTAIAGHTITTYVSSTTSNV